MKNKNHVTLYMSLLKKQYDKIALMAKKNDRTVSAQLRVLIDKVLK